MPFELSGPAGQVIVDDEGRFQFLHEGRTVLRAGASPVFGEVYGVELAVASVLGIEERTGSLVIQYATTAPLLNITLEVETTDTGFRLLLVGAPKLPVAGLAFDLRPGGPWYGLGERVIQTWPLDVAQVISNPLMPFDHAADGTLNIATPVVLGADGVGLLIEETAGELQATIQRGNDRLLRFGVCAPALPFGTGFDAPVQLQGPRLAVDVLLHDDIVQVFKTALQFLGHPTAAPLLELWSKPIWTTWARYKMGIDQATVLQFADEILDHNYPHSVMEIDDRWQTAYGDLDFDDIKFPDPKAMVDRLHDQGFRVTLWVPPFFHPDGAAYREAAAQGFLVRHPATGAPYLTRWWQGYGGLLDVTNNDALAWWHAGLTRLQAAYGIDGFKFDGGEANFVPHEAQTMAYFNRRQYPDRYVAWVAQNFEWTEVRTAWRSQRHGLLFRQWDKFSRWGVDNGLHSILTQALTLSMIGYPFVLPDMIGGNAYAQEVPTRELLIRWTQLSALLPAMQFSIAPWSFDDETDTICRRWAQFHGEIAPYIQSLMDLTIRDGTPVVRPLFWHAPEDPRTYLIDDQFLLGDLLLVAPVVQSGSTVRDIYLPSGRWRDRWTGQVWDGPQQLVAYPAPLDTLPLFERLDGAPEQP